MEQTIAGIPLSEFRDGRKIKRAVFTACDHEITEGEISVNNGGRIFLLQNERAGASPVDKRGYKYSWKLWDGQYPTLGIKEIEWKDEQPMQEFKTGDILTNGKSYMRVLFANEFVVIPGSANDYLKNLDFAVARSPFSISEFKKEYVGFKPYTPPTDEEISAAKATIKAAGIEVS